MVDIPSVGASGWQTYKTPNDLLLMWEGQDDVRLFYNHNLLWFGYLNQATVNSSGDTTPPGSPSLGDMYTVGASPTGDWAGYAEHIALWEKDPFDEDTEKWLFHAPKRGMIVWVEDTAAFRYYDETDSWVAGPT